MLALMASAVVVNAQENALKVGDLAPEIDLLTPAGQSFTLSSLKGKLVLVDFWASWCAPCVEEQPELKALYDKYREAVGGGKFEILGVSLDRKKENWAQCIEKFQITWPQASDLKFWNSKAAKAYGIEELPFNVIVDGARRVLAINLHGKELSDFIGLYLKENK